MPPLPTLTVRVVLRMLRAHGFEVVRERGAGSHRFVAHADGRTTTVSGHAGDELPPVAMAGVLRDCRLTADELTG